MCRRYRRDNCQLLGRTDRLQRDEHQHCGRNDKRHPDRSRLSHNANLPEPIAHNNLSGDIYTRQRNNYNRPLA